MELPADDGVLETLLTLNLTDEITESRGYPDRECVALGAANMAQAAQVGQGGALGFLGIAEQATGSSDGQGQVFAAKALEILGRELLAQAFQGRVALKIPRRTATNTTTFFRRQTLWPVIRDHQLDVAGCAQAQSTGS